MQTVLEKSTHSRFIFLAEDDIDDQEFLIEAFTSINENIQVIAVNNGTKAINYLENIDGQNHPCLIILDYNLPELSGAEILERIQQLKQFNKVPKIVWSTSNSPVYEKKCLDLGAMAYMVKPSDISGIGRLAKQMLEMCKID